MLKIEDVNTFYGNIQALKGISIEINEGEVITLIGANGAGKTTTLMSICGIVPLALEISPFSEVLCLIRSRMRLSPWGSARYRKGAGFFPI